MDVSPEQMAELRESAGSRDVPADVALHWSTRTLAEHLKRREGISVSWHHVARIWREENLKPHRSGTFKISKDPAFAEKVADVVGQRVNNNAK
jgi:transposase